MSKGVKELMEILVGLRICSITGAAVLEEGLELEDINDVIKAAKKIDELKAALDNAEEAIVEAKDLSGEEVALVISSVMKMIRDVKAAYRGEDVAL